MAVKADHSRNPNKPHVAVKTGHVAVNCCDAAIHAQIPCLDAAVHAQIPCCDAAVHAQIPCCDAAA